MLDGLSRIPDLLKKVKEHGQTAVAITDHGGMYGAVSFYNSCKKEGIKAIIGVEAYEHRLGYPYLYATISGGGKSRQWVEAMYKRAATWSSDWRYPMLIVVPDLALHGNILRRVAAEQKANEDFDRKSAAPSYLGSYPVLRFIEQPLPRMVTHKSR